MPEPCQQFAVLHHEQTSSVHWDFLLEFGHILATWQFPADPCRRDIRLPLQVRRIQDHRKLYLDYEGPISGDRGNVRRIDRGTYQMIEHQPHCWTIRLTGEKLTGTYQLLAGCAAGAEGTWEWRRLKG